MKLITDNKFDSLVCKDSKKFHKYEFLAQKIADDNIFSSDLSGTLLGTFWSVPLARLRLGRRRPGHNFVSTRLRTGAPASGCSAIRHRQLPA